jgi:protein phosphatase
MLIFSITDRGLVRHNNEDYHRYDWDKQLMLLADGVGGHAHGEVASQVAVESAWQYMIRNETLDEDERLDLKDALAESMAFANQKVLNQQRIKPAYAHMGTTLIAACLDGLTLHYAWIGDSRIYRICPDEGSITQLTVDHTLYQEKQDKGEDPDLDLTGHLITRMIGSMYNAQPAVTSAEVASNDLILICSDGLSDMISDEAIRDCLLEYREKLAEAPMALRNLVYEAGARDNLTAIVGRIP